MSLIDYDTEIGRGLAQVDQQSVEDVITLLGKGYSVYTAGNGGSFSSAEHFTQDLIKACGIYSSCLNSNTSLISAISNDEDYDEIFISHFFLLPDRFGTLFLISGSGSSKNLVNLMQQVQEEDRKYTIVALVGFDGGDLAKDADYVIHVPLYDMKQVESAHSIILHYIIARLMNESQ